MVSFKLAALLTAATLSVGAFAALDSQGGNSMPLSAAHFDRRTSKNRLGTGKHKTVKWTPSLGPKQPDKRPKLVSSIKFPSGRKPSKLITSFDPNTRTGHPSPPPAPKRKGPNLFSAGEPMIHERRFLGSKTAKGDSSRKSKTPPGRSTTKDDGVVFI